MAFYLVTAVEQGPQLSLSEISVLPEVMVFLRFKDTYTAMVWSDTT